MKPVNEGADRGGPDAAGTNAAGTNAAGTNAAGMRWYADDPRHRARQLVADATVLVSILLFLRLGQIVYDSVQRLQGPVSKLEQAGGGLAGGLSDAAREAGKAPLVGDRLRGPFDAAAGAARSLASAAAGEQLAVHRLALVLGLSIGLLPIAHLIWRWLPRRIRYARETGAALWLSGDTELLALRAATFAPLHQLAQLGPDPVASWRRGDPGAAEALAELELTRLGLRQARSDGS
jgi:hypothetical protein